MVSAHIGSAEVLASFAVAGRVPEIRFQGVPEPLGISPGHICFLQGLCGQRPVSHPRCFLGILGVGGVGGVGVNASRIGLSQDI